MSATMTQAPAVHEKREMAKRLVESIPSHRAMPDDLEKRFQLAQHLFKSGLASAFKSVEAVFFALCYGDELGMGPIEALRYIYVVNGKPTCDTNILRGIAEDYGLIADFHVVERTETRCIVRGRRPGEAKEHEGSFTIEQARRAGLAGKDNWKGYPEDMLYARASGRLLKVVCPRVGHVKTREEAEDEDAAPAPAWQMTVKTHAELTAVKKAREVTDDALKAIVKQATGGRKVEKVEGIAQYTEGEFTVILAALKAWRPAAAPEATGPQVQGVLTPARPAQNQDAEPSVDEQAAADGIPT